MTTDRIFSDNLEGLAYELRRTGKLSQCSIETVIGKEPTMPDSPEADSFLDYQREKAEYERSVKSLYEKVKTLAEEIVLD